MKYINLCGMNLSQIVLGTDGYGERIDENTASAMMKFYFDNGGNVIDTARMYCTGKSEEIVGAFIKDKRDKIYLSTKCSHPLNLEAGDKARLEKDEIASDVSLSLKALDTDYIDILWLHRDDIDKPVEPIIDFLNELVNKGIIKHFGASNWSYDRIKLANEYAKKSKQEGFCASQGLYNIASRNGVWDPTLAHIDTEKEKYDNGTIPVFAFSSQAKGFFEKYDLGELSKKAKDRYLNEKSINTFNIIKERAVKENATVSSVALKMLIEQSNFDVFPIIGPSKLSQLKNTLNLS